MKCVIFGSNTAGRHGAGAALDARKFYGAVYGSGEGLQGHGPKGTSYAIPTKDHQLKPRTLDEIRASVETFKAFARDMLDTPSITFEVWRVGCGLAGYTDAAIAPFFADAPSNCILPPAWERYRVAHSLQ